MSGPALLSYIFHDTVHACTEVVQVMAVKRPPTRIVGVEGDRHLPLGGDEHGITHRPLETGATDCDDLEMMAMQMHGMAHAGLVADDPFDPLALPHLRDHAPMVGVSIDVPAIVRRAAAQVEGFDPFGRP